MIDAVRRNSPIWIRELFWDWSYHATMAKRKGDWNLGAKDRQTAARAYWFVKQHRAEAELIYMIGYKQGQDDYERF